MPNLTLTRFCILPCVVLVCCAPVLSKAENTADNITRVDYVSNLAYGTSLFNFFQDKYFSAITDLLVGKHYNRLNTEDKNAELLLGGMYLSYGLPDKASVIFTELLDQSTKTTSPSVRDRALFHLGRHYYESSNIQSAESSLIEIGDTLSQDYEAERMYMLINILINKSQTAEAMKLLKEIPNISIWHPYAQYNLGTAYLRADQYDDGIELLDDLGIAKAVNLEQGIIKDKSNIALAFSELAKDQPQQAYEYFSRVRIDSSQTSNGLLGLGWSWYKQARYNEALGAWRNLSHQALPSLAKQESLITIPYAYENAAQQTLALAAYEFAITNYNNELLEIRKIISDINNGGFIAALKAVSMGTESSNPASVIGNVGSASNKYLSPLFLSKDFNQAVKELQELIFLSYTLNHWEQDTPALRLILEEKRLTYNREIQKQDHKKIIDSARSLFEKRNQFAEQVRQIEQNDDATALIMDTEETQFKKLESIKNTLNIAGNNDSLNEQREKFRLLNGLMRWRLETEFPIRIWQTKKEMAELTNSSEQFNQTIKSLSKIFTTRPVQYADFLNRIKARESELVQLRAEITVTIKKQEDAITSMSLFAANQYATKIETYLDRALYSKARLYDALTLPQAGNQ
jgi:hypothetical protein